MLGKSRTRDLAKLLPGRETASQGVSQGLDKQALSPRQDSIQLGVLVTVTPPRTSNGDRSHFVTLTAPVSQLD